MNVICATPLCPNGYFNSQCVFYEGANLVYTGINTNDSVQTAIEKINTSISSSTNYTNYISETIINGVVDKSPSENAVYDALFLKADDDNVVHKTGNETIVGVKTVEALPGQLNGFVFKNSASGGGDPMNAPLVVLANGASGSYGQYTEINNTNTGHLINSKSTGKIYEIRKNGVQVGYTDHLGNINAPSFIKTGGTNQQILLADGSTSNLTSKADLVSGKLKNEQVPTWVQNADYGYWNGTSFFQDAGFTLTKSTITGIVYIDIPSQVPYMCKAIGFVEIDSTYALDTNAILSVVDRRYVTDTNLTVIGNTSGTNTGDETSTRIATINHGATTKTILVDTDEVTGQDSANSFSLIRTVWSDVWLYIKSKADLVYKSWVLGINQITGITYTFALNDYKLINVFTNVNPITLTVPTNATVPIPIGTSIKYTQQNTGVVTVGGAGITFSTNLSLSMVQGETRVLTKIDTNTWTIQGNQPVTGAKTYNTYFVNTITGSDSTGVFEDSTHPYATIDYILALGTFTSGQIIFLQNENGVFNFNSKIPVNCDLIIKSIKKVTLDFSNNANSYIGNAFSTNNVLTLDLPLGILKNERSGGAGITLYDTNGKLKILFNVSEIYWNCLSQLGTSFDAILKVSKLSSANTSQTMFYNYNINIVISELICLVSNVSICNGGDITLDLISGIGSISFSGTKTRYNIGDMTCTGSSIVSNGAGKTLLINFMDSVISGNSINLSGSTGLLTISGNIKSCPLFKSDYINLGNHTLSFINFSANILAGSFASYDANLLFENCSIISTNALIRIYNGSGAIIMKNSTFEVINSVPLCAGGASSSKTIKIVGISTNATVISDQTGVTVLTFTNY